MSIRLYSQAIKKVPGLVDKMARYYNNLDDEDGDTWVETLCQYTKNGTRFSHDVFEVGPFEVRGHLMKVAHEMNFPNSGYSLSGDVNQGFTVKRVMKDETYYLVTYKKKDKGLCTT